MPSKRLREETHLPVHTTISDQWTSHQFLTTNEYSYDTIGIQSFLTRSFDSEHFAKSFQQLGQIKPHLADYYTRLDDIEKKIPKDKSNSDLERCAVIIRLRRFLGQNEVHFQDIIRRNEEHLRKCLSENRLNLIIESNNEFVQDCLRRTEAANNYHQAQQAPVLSTQSNVITGLLDCYDFLAPNEYSEKTIGIQAFLTRKSVGDINFSDIIDDNDKRSRQGQQANFTALLVDKRHNLPEIEASVEKCLMLNRLIAYIKENESRFTSIISDIRLDMQFKMTDNQTNQDIRYPENFRQREQDFVTRKHAQEIRRLFYHSHDEVKQPQSLIYLQNRTTEQLLYTIDHMTCDPKSRDTYIKELENIFRTSFMIIAQPHSGVNPVTIYERKGPGEYTAKISVTIISLLNDFMQLRPKLIELYDIEPSLCPISPAYKLEEPRSLSWKTCQLQATGGGKPRTFLYAELSAITIEQASRTDTRVRFAQLTHSFKFAIKLQLNLADNKMPPIYQLSLESLPFSIGAHNNQIPQLLTRVILDDIRRFSKVQPVDVKTIQTFVQRYFIHRTGVEPKGCVNIYLEQELTKALNQRSHFQTLEDIYLDFLVHFVHQVEFMAKHPLLAMYHADNLFLGICNSERAAEAIVQSSIPGSPVIGLRFNSIRIDYNSIQTLPILNRAVKLNPCAIRVDIYNDRTKKLQNRTFDSSTLANDISKFVASAHTENAGRIRILSNFDDRTNVKAYLSFNEFANYYHARLQEISKNDEKYKPVTDLVENANDGNTDEDGLDSQNIDPYNLFAFSPNSVTSFPPLSPSVFETDVSSDAPSVHDYASIPYERLNVNVASPQNVLPPSDRQPQQAPYGNNQEALLQYVLSQPNLAEQVLRQYGIRNVASPGAASQQSVFQLPSQLPYQPQQLPFQQSIPIQIPQQRQPSQLTFQQPQPQPVYQQQQPQIQFQQPFQQPFQQQPYYPHQQQQQVLYQHPQQRASPSVIHYKPTNTNQPSPSPQQFPAFTTNGTDNVSQRLSNQIHVLNLSDGNLDPESTPTIQQMLTDQTPFNLSAQDVQQMIDEITNTKSTEIKN